MKVAIIGSREFDNFDITPYIPKETTEIISGGAVGVDTVAKEYALAHNIKYTEFLPEYNTHGRVAPLIRNLSIVRSADHVIAFWNGESNGTKFVIEHCQKYAIPLSIFMPKEK